MIKRITLIGCEFCKQQYTNAEAADLNYMCVKCADGKAEKILKDNITKLEAQFRANKNQLEQQYADWLANHK